MTNEASPLAFQISRTGTLTLYWTWGMEPELSPLTLTLRRARARL